MTERNKELGWILKQRRLLKGLTLVKLHDLSGVSPTHVGRIEHGKRFPSATTLRKLAEPLGFGEVELLRLAGFVTEGKGEIPVWALRLEQEGASKVLAVGVKVQLRQCPETWRSSVGIIVAIRVWHDMATLLGPPYRAVPVFDVQGEGWNIMNIKIDELLLWEEPALPPMAPQEVKGDAKTD